jgi:ribosome-binding factor A
LTRRQEQLASVLRDAVQEVLSRGLNDPRVSGLITVTGLDLSPDLEHATVRLSVLPAERQTLTFHGIKAAGAHIRREIGDRVKNRKLPQFHFELDTSFKKQKGVIEALEQARHEDKATGWGHKPSASHDDDARSPRDTGGAPA